MRGALSLICRMSNIFFQHFSPSFEGDGEHYGYYAAENERHSVNNSHCRDRCQDCSGNTTTSGYAEKGRHQPNQYPQGFVLSGDFLFWCHNCIYLMFLQPYRSTFFRGCQWLFGGSVLSENGGRYGCRSAGCRGWQGVRKAAVCAGDERDGERAEGGRARVVAAGGVRRTAVRAGDERNGGRAG